MKRRQQTANRIVVGDVVASLTGGAVVTATSDTGMRGPIHVRLTELSTGVKRITTWRRHSCISVLTFAHERSLTSDN